MKKQQKPKLVALKQTEREFMNKALTAQKEGLLTALEVSIAEHSMHVGRPVPEYIRNRVNGYV